MSPPEIRRCPKSCAPLTSAFVAVCRSARRGLLSVLGGSWHLAWRRSALSHRPGRIADALRVGVRHEGAMPVRSIQGVILTPDASRTPRQEGIFLVSRPSEASCLGREGRSRRDR